MIKSRCGIDCNPEKCKEAYNLVCIGCAEAASAPWGHCRVKRCCEGRELAHCGECGDFACKLLQSFSFSGDEHGDDGKRIAQCICWAKEGKMKELPLNN